MTIQEIAFRVAAALAIGALIGWEREKTYRPAGIRTLSLVAIGSVAVTICGQLSVLEYLGKAPFDPNRMASQVISGIGFLGAGAILRTSFSVRGLTTAASIWVVACLSIVSGVGYYVMALLGGAFVFFILRIFNLLEGWIHKNRHKDLFLTFYCKNFTPVLVSINTIIPEEVGSIQHLDVAYAKKKGKQVTLAFAFHMPLTEKEYLEVTENFEQIKGVEDLRILEYAI
ncbi:MAG: MgtC/SapB family protein [Lachnospiraceae bacterium]